MQSTQHDAIEFDRGSGTGTVTGIVTHMSRKKHVCGFSSLNLWNYRLVVVVVVVVAGVGIKGATCVCVMCVCVHVSGQPLETLCERMTA